MKLLGAIRTLLQDPPPSLAFEVSEAGIAAARIGRKAEIAFQPVKPGTLSVSPLHDNVMLADELAIAVRTLAPQTGQRKRRDAVLILPDYCVRTSVLDFDDFPSDTKQQLSLVRFRMKRSLPFDIENAAVSYYAQPAAKKKFDVVVSVTPIEIVARYEAPFRAAGLNPGIVTTSALSALNLVKEEVPTVVAKLGGKVLTILVIEHNVLKLVRSIELSSRDLDEIGAHVYPTFVYVEDNLNTRAEKLLLCGFGDLLGPARQRFVQELQVEVEAVQTAAGPVREHEAGLLGHLAGMGVAS
jgi:type IV pilus assembly protein PilM